MTRHIADHPSPENSGLRLKHFLRLAREEGRHPAAKALHIRREATSAESRLKPLLQMLRGRGEH